MLCVDLDESFQTHIYLRNLASIQPRTSPLKFVGSRDSYSGSRGRTLVQPDGPPGQRRLDGEHLAKVAAAQVPWDGLEAAQRRRGLGERLRPKDTNE